MGNRYGNLKLSHNNFYQSLREITLVNFIVGQAGVKLPLNLLEVG